MINISWANQILIRYIFKVITDANQEVNALRTGDVDIATQLTGETVKLVAEDETVNLLQKPGIQISYAYFNMKNGPTADPKVREALIKAVNYETGRWCIPVPEKANLLVFRCQRHPGVMIRLSKQTYRLTIRKALKNFWQKQDMAMDLL